MTTRATKEQRRLAMALAYIDDSMELITGAQRRAAERQAVRDAHCRVMREGSRGADAPRSYGQRLTDGFRLLGGER